MSKRRGKALALLLLISPLIWAVVVGITPWPSAAFFYGLEPVPDESPENAEEVCSIRDWEISESSGLAASLRYPGYFWTHNDSGDEPRLFLVDRFGETRAVVRVLGEATDWEDMCCFQHADQNWLLIGDVGDNSETRGGSRPPCSLIMLPEPLVKPGAIGSPPHQISRPAHYQWKFRYPSGRPDCESIAADSENNRVLLLTKAAPGQATLYSLPLSLRRSVATRTATEVCQLPVPWATAMDISPGGRRMVIVNPLSGVLFDRDPGQSWEDAIAGSGSVLTLPLRRQGETACFENERSVIVGSEGRWQLLWRVQLKELASTGTDQPQN